MTTRNVLSPELRKLLAGVTGKRARIVAEHIAKNGSITTEDLAEKYGYGHPPRAKQDLQEQGVPIETSFIKNEQGRRIAVYKFGDPSSIRRGRFKGRMAFAKKFKEEIVDLQGEKCGICQSTLAPRYLQIDHRIPYEVAGETPSDKRKPEEFMLVCTSCNRAKSWSCEHCRNFSGQKTPSICGRCYWANTECYSHVAMIETRRLDVVWAGEEVPEYDRIAKIARELAQPLPDFVKRVLAKAVKNGSP
jgi:hypothetical protein